MANWSSGTSKRAGCRSRRRRAAARARGAAGLAARWPACFVAFDGDEPSVLQLLCPSGREVDVNLREVLLEDVVGGRVGLFLHAGGGWRPQDQHRFVPASAFGRGEGELVEDQTRPVRGQGRNQLLMRQIALDLHDEHTRGPGDTKDHGIDLPLLPQVVEGITAAFRRADRAAHHTLPSLAAWGTVIPVSFPLRRVGRHRGRLGRQPEHVQQQRQVPCVGGAGSHSAARRSPVRGPGTRKESRFVTAKGILHPADPTTPTRHMQPHCSTWPVAGPGPLLLRPRWEADQSYGSPRRTRHLAPPPAGVA